MPQITIHVVFDTNAIHAGSADRLLSNPASDLMRRFRDDTSPNVFWHLVPMVKLEREYQMINEAKQLFVTARKAARFLELSNEFTEEDARTRVHSIIQEQIEKYGIKEI